MVDLQNFFTLKKFSHKILWSDQDPIWNPLIFLNEYLKKQIFKIEIKIPEGVYISNKEYVSIGKNTVIEPGVFIQGPCIIGNHCVIRHGAFVRDGVICGDYSVIGHSTEIKHSILLNSVHATHFCYVGDSILGNGVNLGAGVKCSNLRLDRKKIHFYYENKKIQTPMKKLGAIIGDNTQIGCNSVLNPGTCIGKSSYCHPLINVKGYFPPKSLIKEERLLKMETVHESILENLDKYGSGRI